jgi:dGTP triphosphohydrolase
MRGGPITSFPSPENLDFDIYAFFQQDILDYIVTEVNIQVVAAKDDIDYRMEKAQDTLKKAQADYMSDVNAAMGRVEVAKTAYEAKVAAVEGKLATEQARAEQHMEQLQHNIDVANQGFNNAVTKASPDLAVARERRTQSDPQRRAEGQRR